jgi:hypothetical protein
MTRSLKKDNGRDISEYEQQRLDNIQRNEEYLKSLGFGKKPPMKSEAAPKVSRKRKLEKDAPLEDIPPERRSKRIQNLTPEGVVLSEAEMTIRAQKALERQAREKEIALLEDVDVETLIDDENTLRCKVSALELQELIERSNSEHYELIGNDIIEHTAYRMSYMSNSKLANRLKMISRAAGKNSYSKLLAFYYGLKLAKLCKLAEATQAALERCGLSFSE